MRAYRVVRVRAPHTCWSCRGPIPPGTDALVTTGYPGEEGLEYATRPERVYGCEKCERATGTWPGTEADSGAAQYIRSRYGSPTVVGQRVNAGGRPGTVTGFHDARVWILLDGEQRPGLWHPTWHVQYLTVDGAIAWEDPCLPSAKCQSCDTARAVAS